MADYDYDKQAKSGVAGGYYSGAKSDRDPYLVRARRASELTSSTLFRQEGANGADDAVVPWNSIGAYCVFNLASKVVFSMFPPGITNIKLEQDDRAATDLEQLPEDQRGKIKQVIDAGLSKIEQDTTKAIAADGDRPRMFVAALRMLVGGNHGFQFYDDATIRGIPLERFCTTRDGQGTVIRFCVEDNRDWADLDEDVLEGLKSIGVPTPEPDPTGKRPVCIYTYGNLGTQPPYVDKRYTVHQEVLGLRVPGTDATYTKEALPYLFIPWLLLDGEHYGRSYCEFYEGDLLTAESLTKALGEGAAMIARFVTLISPTGLTNKKMFAAAKNGDVITGREADVHVVTSEKGGDFNVAKTTLDDGLARLSKAFLLNTSVQRSGERVTAEEIRYVAQELEEALGGVYAQQEVTWQTPFMRTKLRLLMKAGRVTRLPEGTIKMTVTAGQAALARNSELGKLRQGVAILAETFGPDKVPQFLKQQAFATRMWTALGVDFVGLVPTEEELAQQAQQEQMAMMAQKLGPEAIKQVGSNVTSNQVAQTNADAKVAVAATPAQAPDQGA